MENRTWELVSPIVMDIFHEDEYGMSCPCVILTDISSDEVLYRTSDFWEDSLGVPHLICHYYPNANYIPDQEKLRALRASLTTEDEWNWYSWIEQEWPMVSCAQEALAMLEEQIARVGRTATFGEDEGEEE